MLILAKWGTGSRILFFTKEHTVDTLKSMFLLFFGAVATWAVSTALPPVLFRWRLREQDDLLRDWKSTYQGIDEVEGTWVTEDVHVDISGKQLRFKNSNNSHGYDYTALGELKSDHFIVGDWVSQRIGTNAKGAFVLTVSARGNCMYGYWFGPDKAGARRLGGWVLADTTEGLEQAKKLLAEMLKPSPIN
jgi:hypothetical protein